MVPVVGAAGPPVLIAIDVAFDVMVAVETELLTESLRELRRRCESGVELCELTGDST